MKSLLQLLARVFLSLIFLVSGLGKIMNISGTQQYMAQHGIHLTGLFLAGVICIEILGGLSVLLGWKARWGALALALYLIPATLIFHAKFSDQMQLIQFQKNLAIIGGLLLVVAFEAGRISIGGRSPKGHPSSKLFYSSKQ